MDHFNHLCQDAVSHLGANKMLKAIVRMGKAVQSMSDALHHFNNKNDIHHRSGAHTQRFEAGDLSKIVHEIQKKKGVFSQTFLVVTTLYVLK